MRPFLLFVAALVGLASIATHARARIQPEIICIDPDMEFPVACDEDGD
jgi:hypothetical protein